MSILAVGCGGESRSSTVDSVSPIADPGVDTGPVVEVVPTTAAQPPLDPNAAPTTPLGELRARYLPIWSPDFDWAFPPEVCGSDWALDAIAEPNESANLAALGDIAAAAALSVMRFDFLLTRALTQPHVLEQLCVAVATVGSSRTEALDLLAEYLDTGVRAAGTPSYPQEVTIVAASPTAALAVACVVAEPPQDASPQEEVADESAAAALLQAYLLAASRGLEDAVADVSLRVANVVSRPVESCTALDSWSAEWAVRAEEWAASGGLWGPVERTVSVEELCRSQRADGPGECPREWGP